MVFMASPVLNNFPKSEPSAPPLDVVHPTLTEFVFLDGKSLSKIATLH